MFTRTQPALHSPVKPSDVENANSSPRKELPFQDHKIISISSANHTGLDNSDMVLSLPLSEISQNR